MIITVTGKHFDITDPIREHASQRANRLPRYFNGVSKVEVVVDKPDQRHYGVEMIVHVDGHDHVVARSKGEDLYATIDDSAAKAERQLHDHKEKLRDRQHAHRG